jgi:hypothetical protein
MDGALVVVHYYTKGQMGTYCVPIWYVERISGYPLAVFAILNKEFLE